jgi:hypothetical protein
MDGADAGLKGMSMAENESLLASPPTQDVAVHVRDYGNFLRMLKWTAVIAFGIALIVLVILYR